jgi:hypothetical protein
MTVKRITKKMNWRWNFLRKISNLSDWNRTIWSFPLSPPLGLFETYNFRRGVFANSTNNLPLVCGCHFTGAFPSPDWAEETSHAWDQQVRARAQPQTGSNSQGTQFNVLYRHRNRLKRVIGCRVAGDKSKRTFFRSTSNYRSWRRHTY